MLTANESRDQVSRNATQFLLFGGSLQSGLWNVSTNLIIISVAWGAGVLANGSML